MKERQTVINLPVLRYYMSVVITDNIMESRLKRTETLGPYTKEGDKSPAAMHSGVTGHNKSFLFFRFNPTPGELAHECFHAVYRMLNWIGADLDNEIVAYHLTYLVDQIWEFAKEPTEAEIEKTLDTLAAKVTEKTNAATNQS